MDIYLPIAEMSVNAPLLILLGALVGFISGMFGIGGGFLMTPVLVFLGIPPAVAVASMSNHVAASSAYAALPRGPVHADLFRDNAMFEAGTDGAAPRLSGVFDFYFAGTDTWLFDLAVCLNDWAIDLPTGTPDPLRAEALLAAYLAVRPLTGAERTLLPAMLRAAALRFWISRLWDFHLPREASMLQAHDPTHFERVLRERAREPLALQAPAMAA